MIHLALTQIKPEISSRMRGRQFVYIENFMKVASQLEQDVLEEQKLIKPVTISKPQTNEPTCQHLNNT